MTELISQRQLDCGEWTGSPPMEVAAVDCIPWQIARAAVDALIAEAVLSPKPALVDCRGPGAHTDLSLDILLRSANSLLHCFVQMAAASASAEPSSALRAELAEIGRAGEQAMYAVTGGCNAHKGAIWALGLLLSGASMSGGGDPQTIAEIAGEIARYPDSSHVSQFTHGLSAARKFGVAGARGEAYEGFPHVVKLGLPVLQNARQRGIPEPSAQLDTLLAIMSELDDTCLLHRAGMNGLMAAKAGARQVLATGGTSTLKGRQALARLEQALLEQNASPGGSADLLAATLFLDSLKPRVVFLSNTEGSCKNGKDEF